MTVARDLIARRIPHIVGAYLAASWILIEFLTWAVSRFVLSSHLIDLALTVLLLLTPTVVIIAYFHGTPGRDQSPRVEKLAVAANLVVALAISLVLFGGRDLGRATITVVIEDEGGTQSERVIPKPEFRRSLAVFQFENLTDDDSSDWLEYAIPEAVAYDLSQDVFVSARTDFDEPLRDAGFPDGARAPLALKIEIARDRGLSYVVSGRFTRRAGELSADITLHEASTGRQLAERTSVADHVFGLVDAITSPMKEEMDLPEGHLRTAPDLPVSELLTSSEAALRHFVEAMRLSDPPERAERLAEATEEDPTFAVAQFELFLTRRRMGLHDEALPSLEAAMQHSYRIPERRRYWLTMEHHLVAKDDPERALAVAGTWTQHLPWYPPAYRALANVQRLNGQKREAISTYEQILEVDPRLHIELLNIAAVYEELDELDGALEYRLRYAERLPNEPAALISLSRGYRLVGRHDEAKAACERVLLLEPEHVDAQSCLALLDEPTRQVERGR